MILKNPSFIQFWKTKASVFQISIFKITHVFLPVKWNLYWQYAAGSLAVYVLYYSGLLQHLFLFLQSIIVFIYEAVGYFSAIWVSFPLAHIILGFDISVIRLVIRYQYFLFIYLFFCHIGWGTSSSQDRTGVPPQLGHDWGTPSPGQDRTGVPPPNRTELGYPPARTWLMYPPPPGQDRTGVPPD